MRVAEHVGAGVLRAVGGGQPAAAAARDSRSARRPKLTYCCAIVWCADLTQRYLLPLCSLALACSLHNAGSRHAACRGKPISPHDIISTANAGLATSSVRSCMLH